MREEDKQLTFKELFSENYSRLYYVALYLLNDSETARDAVYDSFATVWEEFRKESNPPKYNYTYLYKVVHSHCVDMLRHQNVHNKYAMLYKQLHDDGLLYDDNDKDSRLEIIYKVLEEMPPRTRFIMEQCYFEDKKYVEVAEILGLSRDGIRAQVMKGLEMLRNVFSVKYKKGQ